MRLEITRRADLAVRTMRVLGDAHDRLKAHELAEALCTTPGSPAYDSETCSQFRLGGEDNVARFGVRLSYDPASRSEDVCGPDGTRCLAAAATGLPP